ncbi:UNVERIFIED_CONTAM: hypothetical protein Sradi_6886100 [Sesamum radiatum]|uniref:Uncharacterized protein n=1 Tax=Sesamum radiatum TaxID=300843 RepID=A0AAW2JJV2_SESRA
MARWACHESSHQQTSTRSFEDSGAVFLRQDGSQSEPGQSYPPEVAQSSLPPPDGTTCCTIGKLHPSCPRPRPDRSRHSQGLVALPASRATPCQ